MRHGLLLARQGVIASTWVPPEFSPVTVTLGSAAGGGVANLAMLNFAPSGASAPSVVQFATAFPTGGTSATVTLASTPTVGNLLVALIGYGTQTLTPPAGFTAIPGSIPDTGGRFIWIGTRVVQSGDGKAYTYTLSAAANSYTAMTVLELAGAGALDQLVSDQSQTQSPYAMPALTPTVHKSLVLGAAMANAGGTTFAPSAPAGWQLVSGAQPNYGTMIVIAQAQT